MYKLLMLVMTLFFSACTAPNDTVEANASGRLEIRLPTSSPAFKAAQYLNYAERTHRSELRELTGVDPVRTEWCAAFVNAVLEESSITSNNSHRYPLTARAFLDWGKKVSKQDIKPGDIVVFPRGNQGWQGHVGFFIKEEIINGVTYYYILGGNQNNKVSIVAYRASRALGIRRPNNFI